ncbi:MAG: hypothetical protein ABI867_08925 [Kofleriaceae bacterium]
MTKKRPRTERRIEERAARQLVRDREKLAALSPGGARERPIVVESSSVIEVRARAMPCPQCAGELRVGEHRAETGLRVVQVTCTRCHAGRELWFRLAITEPN